MNEQPQLHTITVTLNWFVIQLSSRETYRVAKI